MSGFVLSLPDEEDDDDNEDLDVIESASMEPVSIF